MSVKIYRQVYINEFLDPYAVKWGQFYLEVCQIVCVFFCVFFFCVKYNSAELIYPIFGLQKSYTLRQCTGYMVSVTISVTLARQGF